MALFPMFIEMSGKKVLVVGGGNVALRKCEKLLPYGAELTAVSGRFQPQFISLQGVALLFRPFRDEDIAGRDIVIAATDDRALNAHIAGLCREAGIPFNCVDEPENCTFIFPALTLRGRLSAGFCTGGASPTAAAYFREQFEESLPDGLDEILDFMAGIRPRVIAAVPDQRRRSRIFALLFAACIEAGGEPDEDFVNSLVPELGEEN
ncbi:MAG TPA: bifunctional precorrin-2 dehydrogenase/sirohydrochlorin ferrochelatase [Candidatus Scatomorpha merdigallinarum]|nr:bifunctional precorrin-2 dehydrogenase/sirohydrochlorin ferrochelatase [Candidatus Scatomorpha merdigallinarum]